MTEDHKADTSASASNCRPFQLGWWRVEPARNLLVSTAQEVALTHRSMEVLCRLAHSSGEVVSRQDLLHQVWGDTVVNEEVLTRVISDLRRALGDDRTRPSYIETIPKRGYRLVTEPGPVASSSESASLPKEASSRNWLWAVAAVPVAVLILLSLWWTTHPSETEPIGAIVIKDLVSLTSDPGYDSFPAFSHDGTRLAFCRRPTHTTPYRIFVKQPGQAREIDLTQPDFDAVFPRWSPDDAAIAFVRVRGNDKDICTVPSLGGPSKVLYTLSGRVRGLDWSPDGKNLVFDYAPNEGVFTLQVLSLSDGQLQQITQPRHASWGDFSPRYSPNGESIAFVRDIPDSGRAVMLMPAEGGDVRRLTRVYGSIYSFDWHPNGRDLLLVGVWGEGPGLWRENLGKGQSQRLHLPNESVRHIAVNPVTGGLALQMPRSDYDLMLLELDAETGQEQELPSQVVFESTQPENLPAVDPHQGRIAFVSQRAGQAQVYLAESAGAEPEAITSFRETHPLGLVWAPDGSKLLIGGREAEDIPYLSVFDPQTGMHLRIPFDGGTIVDLTWSADSQWIYIFAYREGDVFRYRVKPDGSNMCSGIPVGFMNVIGPGPETDSHYFLDQLHPGLRLHSPKGQKSIVAEYPPTNRLTATGFRDGKVYFMVYRDKKYQLVRHDLATGIQHGLGFTTLRCVGSLAVLPDGKSLVVAVETKLSADIFLATQIP